MRLNNFPKLRLIFCCHQQKIQKWAIFDILMTITLGVNMITRQMTPLFSPTLWVLSVRIFHFWISRPSKFNSTCIIFRSVKHLKHLHAKDDTFKPVNTDTLFLQKICYFLVYNMFWYKFDINMSIPWTTRCDICSYSAITKPQ